MLFFLARLSAALYFINSIDNNEILKRTHIVLKYESWIFLLLFLYVIGSILTINGYAYNPKSFVISVEPMKFLHNFQALPIITSVFVAGVVLLLLGFGLGMFSKSDKGIWPAGIGIVMVVTSLFLILGYNHTAFYPSLADIQSSLTIQNSSSSHYTLRAMAYVSLLVPFVLGYIVIVWRIMNRKKMTVDEVKNDSHHY